MQPLDVPVPFRAFNRSQVGCRTRQRDYFLPSPSPPAALPLTIYSGYCGSTSLGFGQAWVSACFCFFFVDVEEWQLLHHPVRLCESERCKYADLTVFFIRFPDLCLRFDQAVRPEDIVTGQWSVMSLASIVVFIYAHN